jgi:hypothetical protein
MRKFLNRDAHRDSVMSALGVRLVSFASAWSALTVTCVHMFNSDLLLSPAATIKSSGG